MSFGFTQDKNTGLLGEHLFDPSINPELRPNCTLLLFILPHLTLFMCGIW